MKRMDMKKLFLLALAALMMTMLLSCSSDGGGGDDDNASGGQESVITTLTVKNASSYTLYDVKWDGTLISSSAGIDSGASAKKSVSEGFGYIYFAFYPNGSDERMQCYTATTMDISNGDEASFTFTNNTVVVQLDDVENKAALGRLKFRTTTLSIKNSSSYDLYDIKWCGESISSTAGIDSGFSATKAVSEGGDCIYFSFYPNGSDKKMQCYTADAVDISNGDEASFTFTNDTVVVQLDDVENKMALGLLKFRTTTLSIKNNSSYDLVDTVWQTYIFSSNSLNSVLEKGTEIVNDVKAGYGYIYFTRRDTEISVRTNSVVLVNDLNSEQFEITDVTDVVEVNNESNIGVLSDIEKKVVFFDGAEGDYYPYTERKNVTYSYYASHSGEYGIDLTKGTLELSIFLEKSAKLSLWYASSRADHYTTKLSINNENVKIWTGGNEWSFYTINLSAGENIIRFEDNGGYRVCLDDILIVYTD